MSRMYMANGNNTSSSSSSKLLLYTLLVLVLLAGNGAAGLGVGFYRQSCPNVESIVRNVTWTRTAADRSLAAKLLRLYFHDCFVQGCDASVLLDGSQSEKAAGPNQSLGGLEVIDAAKAAVEEKCPGTVSCADIIALATRDAVSFQFKRLLWQVETGRRDSRVSRAVNVNLPSPEFVFPLLKKSFADRGLTVADLVALSGGHTLGRTSCAFVAPRLYTFSGNGGLDPLIDRGYAAALKRQCPSVSSRGTVPMDPGSESKFDSSYYSAVKANRGVLLTDAALLHDDEAARLVTEFQDQAKFLAAFAASIGRMGAIGVLTGNAGEIRRNCHFVN